MSDLKISILFVIVLSMSIFACSKSGTSSEGDTDASSVSVGTSRALPSRTGSCDRVAATSTCSEYSGSYLAQNEAFLTSSCQKLSGTFAYAGCPNTSVIGSCLLSTGELRRFYASGGATFDVDRAKSECEGSFRGTWQRL